MRYNAQAVLKWPRVVAPVDLDPIPKDASQSDLKRQWVKALMPPSKKTTH